MLLVKSSTYIIFSPNQFRCSPIFSRANVFLFHAQTLSSNSGGTGLRARKIDPNGKINANHEVNLHSCVTASKILLYRNISLFDVMQKL